MGQSTWTSVSSSTNKNLWGVTWADGLFVAVGDEGTVLTSSDGREWTQRPSGTTETLRGVSSADRRFVAVGTNATILLSSDGFSWRKAEMAETATGPTDLNAVLALPGKTVALGDNGTYAYE